MRKNLIIAFVGILFVAFGSVGVTFSFADDFDSAPFEFTAFGLGDLDYFQAEDDDNSSSDLGDPTLLGFDVTIGGATYDRFDMDSNGYIELLLGDSASPEEFGLGAIDDLIDSGSSSSTYILSAYDDLDSDDFGFYGYKLYDDQAVFYYDTETYDDEGEKRPNSFQVILNEEGDVKWNFNDAKVEDNSDDLFSGLYFGNTGDLHELTRDEIPDSESWVYDEGDNGAAFSEIVFPTDDVLSGTGMLGEEVPYEFERFALGDLDYFQSLDDDNSSSDLGDPTLLGFDVTIGGATYDRFDMDSNGYIELLFGDSDDPTEFGYGDIDDLIGNDPTSTYLLAAYDDLSSDYFGFYGYKLFSDHALFHYDTETFFDGDERLVNGFQVLLFDNGDVQWNYNYANLSGHSNDLFSGLYFGNTGTLHKLYRDELPELESWYFTERVDEDEQTNVIPEPATLVLFGSGLLGAFVRRRKRIIS